jgi:phosphatidylserine/phosphatidylglycerophosphate/cardiolipin synthase-like enzyme
MNSLDVRIYDPRALDPASATRASLHAKVLIVDRRSALVTSANFTDAAQKRNVETGVLITYRPFVIRLADTFAGLQKHLFVELH